MALLGGPATPPGGCAPAGARQRARRATAGGERGPGGLRAAAGTQKTIKKLIRYLKDSVFY